MVKNCGRLGIGTRGRTSLADAMAASLLNPRPSEPRGAGTAGVGPGLGRAPRSVEYGEPAGSRRAQDGSNVSASALAAGPRGSSSAALSAAATAADLDWAMSDMLAATHANSSRASRASMIRTWTKFHLAAFAHDLAPPEPFPLSPLAIRRVGSLFRAGRYLSFNNYASAARAEHIGLGLEAGGGWSALLERTFRDVCRAVNRGVGTSRQSQPIDPLRAASLDLDDSPLVTGGPLAPMDFCSVGIFFLLREIEIAAARLSHLHFSDWASLASGPGGSATLLLPSSKTDPRAVGVSRTWDCVCNSPAGAHLPCPCSTPAGGAHSSDG